MEVCHVVQDCRGSETAQDQIGWDLRYASLPTFYRFARHLRTQHSIKYHNLSIV